MSSEYVQALEEECNQASVLIGVLRLAAQGHDMASLDYPPYRQYLEAQGRRLVVQKEPKHDRHAPSRYAQVVETTPTILEEYDSLPATLSEPIYNEDGFAVGFQVVHPPGVECVFPPSIRQCSCGRMDIGIVASEDSD